MKLKFLLRCIPDITKEKELYLKGRAIVRIVPSYRDLMDTVYFTAYDHLDRHDSERWAFYKLKKLNRKKRKLK